MADPDVVDVDTSEGPGRLWLYLPRRRPRATLVLGHGAGGGVSSWDLAALAAVLPDHGYRVLLMEQPWRVAGRRVAVAPDRLDAAWYQTVHAAQSRNWVVGPLVLGGRSAGARVACRSARPLNAAGVLALAFPLQPPGRPVRSRAPELACSAPLLVVQGERDRFGGPAQVRRMAPHAQVVAIPGANHGLTVGARSLVTQAEVAALITDACLGWLHELPTRAATRHRRRESVASQAR